MPLRDMVIFRLLGSTSAFRAHQTCLKIIGVDEFYQKEDCSFEGLSPSTAGEK